jgi:hypothetical protein
VLTSTDIGTLEHYVTQAEDHKGGWVQIVFHHVCATGCVDAFSVSPDTLNQLITWLSARTSQGTRVKTVQQVVGGPVRPAVHGYALPLIAN